ncbi:MAG: beta strand repeat-containing protein, partial [Acidimicrobiales bacterium]
MTAALLSTSTAPSTNGAVPEQEYGFKAVDDVGRGVGSDLPDEHSVLTSDSGLDSLVMDSLAVGGSTTVWLQQLAEDAETQDALVHDSRLPGSRLLDRSAQASGVSFVANDGSAHENVDYAAVANRYKAVLVDGAVALVGNENDGNDAVIMSVIGGSAETDTAIVSAEAVDPSVGAGDRQAVSFADVLPGVDVVYSADGGDVEYSFVIEPGADPDQITLDFAGARGLTIEPDGTLSIDAESGLDYISTAPYTFQNIDGAPVTVASSYALGDDGTVGFTLGAYDLALPVIIDPTFVAVETASGSYTTGSTIDLPVPVAVATDDLLIAQIAYSAVGGGIITPPAGWTLIDLAGANGITQALYWRVATASEPASYSFTLSSGATDTAAGAINAYAGVDTTSPIDVYAGQNNTSGALVEAPSVTPTVAGATLVSFFAVRDDGSLSAPGGMAERSDLSSGAGGAAADETIAATYDQLLGAAGATGTRVATAVATAGSIGHSVALAPATGGGGGTNLVMVTGDGAYAGGTDSAKRTLFQSFGWTVTAIDDNNTGSFVATAAANDVMFVSDTARFDISYDTRNLDIGIVNENFSGWNGLLSYGSQPQAATTGTALNVVDNSHYITSTFGTGSLTIHSASDTISYWPSGPNALPAAVTVLVESPTSTSHEALHVAETGAALYSGLTATNRRVWFPSDSANPSNFTTDYETLLERSLDWAAGNDASSVPVSPTVTVNSTGDAVDANIGDDLCDTGGTNADGDPECTLRAAMAEANASVTVNAIRFIIPATDSGHSAGVWTISAATDLATATAPVTVDGSTQPGWVANTTPAPGGLNGTQVVVIDGGGSTSTGLAFGDGSAGSVVRGLVISNFVDRGIHAYGVSGGASLLGNYIGTNAAGTAAASTEIGVFVQTDGVRVGSGNAADRNLISGNADLAVRFAGSSALNGVVQGNLIGTDTTGNTLLPNLSWGVMTDNGGQGLTLGTDGDGIDDATEGNVVAGSSSLIVLSGDDNIVAGNRIGIAGDGTILGASGLHISGTARVGTDVDGQSDAVEGNLMVGVSGSAVRVSGAASVVSVLGNSMYNNSSLGIDLNDDLVTANDANDVDSGPNGYLNFPVATGISELGGTVTVDFDLDVPAGNYRVEVFTNPSGADPSGYGEGEVFEFGTTVAHTGSGSESFQIAYSGSGTGVVTLTATEDLGGGSFGSTSEFSAAAIVCGPDADSDGLVDCYEDANTDTDGDPSTNPGPNTDGDGLANYIDADDDGDGTPTASENADPNADGDPRDALDSDRDGQPDYLDVEAGPSTTPVADEQKISDLAGSFAATLNNSGDFGGAVSAIGDVDGDGVSDAVVGAGGSDRGGAFRGAAYILFLNPDGTVKAEQEISSIAGGLTGPIDDNDSFAVGVAGIGDIDGDQVPDIAIGAYRDDDGGADYGAVYIVFLNSDGTVKDEQKISALQGGLTTTLSASGRFGISVTGLGDVDGDGINDIAVGEDFNDDGGANRGAAHVLFLNTDGTVKAEQKISDTTGGFTATLDNSDLFGRYVAGPGDINGDGTPDLAVNAAWDDDGGSNRGAVHVLFLNPDGTVDSEQKISDTAGGFAPALADSDTLGSGIGGVGDLDGDGTPDLAIGASGRDDGGANRGAVYLVQLNTDGTVKDTDTLSSTSGGLAGPLDNGDGFGSDVHGLGDLDGDGTLNVLVGARYDDDGGTSRGAVYVLDLSATAPPGPQTYIVNSTGVATDNNTADGLCDTGATNSQGATECTLRAAIEQANAHSGPDSIDFNMPTTEAGHAAGVWTITPSTGLPVITDPVAIDGTTQAGAAPSTNSFPNPVNSSLAIRLAVSDSIGLHLSAGSSGSEIRGLAITATGSNHTSIGISDSSNHVIAGNHFGVTADGLTALANDTSIHVFSSAAGNRIGGSAPADRNLFTHSTYSDISVSGASSGTIIQGNDLGFYSGGGSAAVGGSYGIVQWGGSTGSLIGGDGAGEGNRVRDSARGVWVDSAGTTASILGNHIYDNSGIGINLVGGTENNLVTENDAGDGDTGPNDLLNYPVITSTNEAAGTVTVDFDLDVPAGDYRIEAFTNPSGAHANGYGEGESFETAALISHSGSGAESFQMTYTGSVGDVVALTATEQSAGPVYGVTSEFASAYTVPPASCTVDSDSDGLWDCEEDANTDA